MFGGRFDAAARGHSEPLRAMVDIRDRAFRAAAADLGLQAHEVPEYIRNEIIRLADLVSDGVETFGFLEEAGEEDLAACTPALLRANLRQELAGLIEHVQVNPHVAELDPWECMPAKLLLVAENHLPAVSPDTYRKLTESLANLGGGSMQLEDLPSDIPESILNWSVSDTVEELGEPEESEERAAPTNVADSDGYLALVESGRAAPEPSASRKLSAEDRTDAKARLVARARQESLATDIKDTLLVAVVAGGIVGMLFVYLLVLPVVFGILDIRWIGDARDVLIAWATGGVGMLMWKARHIERRKAGAPAHYESLSDRQLAETYCREIHPMSAGETELWMRLDRYRR